MRDRGGCYALAASRALLHAIQVADCWHLMENASQAFLDAVLSPSDEGMPVSRAMLKRFKGIGPELLVLWSEGLFRNFSNRRQVAAYAGSAPTP